ncbi:hypothetical protein AGABI1DRAFT_100733 [Agaricus bisporus var. burnettii JB137-S8]|uniref:ASTRA-associated protein 1 n=1 Tax=Agaricus bisporus var. burnettii (strain JB137-S8 / ATCC MYA-4627 / FGSC 10392) TaxID=597362 RepID=K5XUE2_AGABU|nr:uncharacterized protein AGABI1DRAFT_100733 [Agaricus bisporus var. burnettii JB137-S8]EKM78695.1 hypothetical protein AGABI1DRAFT_100733 [Agaricus bisporus var. burnettii JB137-S8]
MALPPPAAPNHLLRLHSQPVSALAFSEDNTRLYSGDSSGLVAVTSTWTLRPIAKWQPHSDGLLGIEEWQDEIITHGRDNKLHIWKRTIELPGSARLGDTAASLDLPIPDLSYSLDVNALNYCRFSLMLLDSDNNHKRALLAVPGLIDSSVADVWCLPSRERIHAAIGQETRKSIFSTDPKGIIMGLHLFTSNSSHNGINELRILCAYENGSVTLRKYARINQPTSIEGEGWEVLWTSKLHAETIMSLRVSRQNDFALTVSADHLICRYNLLEAEVSSDKSFVAHKTKHPGNAAIAIRDDGRVCAVGGWDGNIRLYSTRTMKPLGTLKYHKSSCQTIEFARFLGVSQPAAEPEDDTSSDEWTQEEKTERDRWLTAGGKDCRVSIWSLISFSR